MKLGEFYDQLGGLLDKGWKVRLTRRGNIRLSRDGGSHQAFSHCPLSAVATEVHCWAFSKRNPCSAGRALGFCFRQTYRLVFAADNRFTSNTRVRAKLLKVLELS